MAGISKNYIKDHKKKEDDVSPEKLKSIADKYELDDNDRFIMKHIIQFPKITNRELGAMLGMHLTGIHARRKKPAFIKAYKDLQDSAGDLLVRAARDAARRLIALVNDPDKNVALKAIRMALTPYLGPQNEMNISVPILKVYDTTVKPDGTLFQQVIEAEAMDALEKLRGGIKAPPIDKPVEAPEE